MVPILLATPEDLFRCSCTVGASHRLPPRGSSVMPSDLITRARRAVPAVPSTAPRRAPGVRPGRGTLGRRGAHPVPGRPAAPVDRRASVWSWGRSTPPPTSPEVREPAWAGLTALREKTLDVDLLMIVAAIGARLDRSGRWTALRDRHLRHLRRARPGHRPYPGSRARAPRPRADRRHAPCGRRERGDGPDAGPGGRGHRPGPPGERVGADGRVLGRASEGGPGEASPASRCPSPRAGTRSSPARSAARACCG